MRAVTFDVGGTLIEPWPSVGHIYAQVAAENGITGIRPEELNRRFAAAWQAYPQFQHTRAAWGELVDLTFRGLTPAPPTSSFFAQLYDRFSEPTAWRIYDDVIPALERLAAKGLALGVISNWDDRLRPLLHRLELGRFFRSIVVSCEAGRPKPDPAIFQQAATDLSLSPSAILHVGDSLENDVEGARVAGFQSLWLRRYGKQTSPGTIRTLAELS